MKTKFSKTDLGCVIGDKWVIFGNRIRESDDGLYLTGNGEPEKVLPFPFTLEQFRAFCERRPDFLWEAIESVFTNDDGSLDDAAIDRLNPASGAADLVRAILSAHDAEFLRTWAIHEELAGVDDQIQVLKGLQPSTITEVAEKAKMLAELETKRSSRLGLIDGEPDPSTAQDELALPQALPNSAPASAEQVDSVQSAESERPDYSMLADPDELIAAFGRQTGMEKAWFSNLTDKPGLMRARRVEGMKGRGGYQPLFCPLKVMEWLTTSRRKVGLSLPKSIGWQLLERHFPKVYAAHADQDPRETSWG